MRRRDFTINAMARRLETGEIVDPLGGRKTSSRACCGRCRRRASRRTRCVSYAGFASCLSSAWNRTSRRFSKCATRQRRSGSSPESASAAVWQQTGWASSRSSCSARTGARAADRSRHRRARRAPSGVRTRDRLRPGEQVPLADRRRAHVRGRAGGGRRRPLARRAARGALPRSRQAVRRVARLRRAAALLRKAGFAGKSHEQVGAELAKSALARLRYPNALRRASSGSSATTCSARQR